METDKNLFEAYKDTTKLPPMVREIRQITQLLDKV